MQPCNSARRDQTTTHAHANDSHPDKFVERQIEQQQHLLQQLSMIIVIIIFGGGGCGGVMPPVVRLRAQEDLVRKDGQPAPGQSHTDHQLFRDHQMLSSNTLLARAFGSSNMLVPQSLKITVIPSQLTQTGVAKCFVCKQHTKKFAN